MHKHTDNEQHKKFVEKMSEISGISEISVVDSKKISELKELFIFIPDDDYSNIKLQRDNELKYYNNLNPKGGYKKRKTMKKGGTGYNCPKFTPNIMQRWPDQGGCIKFNQGSISYIKILKGAVLDRFGSPTGGFLGIPDDSYVSRSIPYINNETSYNSFIKTDRQNRVIETNNEYHNSPVKYHKYRVIKEFMAYVCIASPLTSENVSDKCFYRPGGAIQFALFKNSPTGLGLDYSSTVSVQSLIEKKYLQEINPYSEIQKYPNWINVGETLL